MNPELIRLIESNGIQIHGDVEYFAALVAAAEREECAALCEQGIGDWRLGKRVSAAIRARGDV